jgi:hypothetical protein
VVFSGSRLAKARVERNDFENLDGFKLQLGCGPFNCLFIDESEVVLQGVEDRENRGALAHWIVSDAFVDFFFEFWRDFESHVAVLALNRVS